MAAEVTFESIQAARERIRAHVRETPVLRSDELDRRSGAQLFFKCENFQYGGAFKARGAANAVWALDEQRLPRGVVTHSSGNHGAAVARAAQLRRVRAHVVMPENSSAAKLQAVRRFGGDIELCAPTLAAREAAAARWVERTGAAFIHPYDDPLVIAGQGTLAIELLEQAPALEWIITPVGGGGLLSGVAVAAHALRPALRILGAEPAGADDAYRSFSSGELQPSLHPSTIADGLRGALSARTLAIVRAHAQAIVTVSEQQIIEAMRTLWSELKIVIEPSSAVAYAGVLKSVSMLQGARVGVVLTGGNVDLDTLPWVRAP